MVAQNYANLCNFEHNDDRSSQSSTFSYVGENLYAATGDLTRADYNVPVQSWYDEVAVYDYNTKGCTAVCGHYTQVIIMLSWSLSAKCGSCNVNVYIGCVGYLV